MGCGSARLCKSKNFRCEIVFYEPLRFSGGSPFFITTIVLAAIYRGRVFRLSPNLDPKRDDAPFFFLFYFNFSRERRAHFEVLRGESFLKKSLKRCSWSRHGPAPGMIKAPPRLPPDVSSGILFDEGPFCPGSRTRLYFTSPNIALLRVLRSSITPTLSAFVRKLA